MCSVFAKTIRLSHHVVNAEALCRKLLEVDGRHHSSVISWLAVWYKYCAQDSVLVQRIRGGIVGDLSCQNFQQGAKEPFHDRQDQD